MKKILMSLFLLNSIFTAFELSATTKARYLRKLNIGMTEEEVIKILGNPDSDRASMASSKGQTYRLLEYYVEKKKTAFQICMQAFAVIFTFGLYLPVVFIPGETETYWMEFEGGKLVVWRKAGDLQSEHSYDINHNLTVRA